MKSKKVLTLSILAALAAGSTTGFAAAEMDTYTLEDTVVTAERIPSARRETPANVAVITAADIAANHYRDVAEALDQVNGVIVTRSGSGEEDIVRLNGDDRVVILVDGQRVNNDQGTGIGRASADLKMLPSVKNIQRIEVVKGGASALYGSDAVGGVVNIITKKGIKNETTLDANTGSWKTHNYELTNQGREGDFSWFLTGGIQKRGYFKYKANGDSNRMPSSDYDNDSLSLRLDQKLTDTSSLQLNFAHRTINSSQYYNFGPSSDQDEIFNNVALSYKFKEDSKAPGVLRYFNNYKSADFSGKFNTRMQGVDYQDGWQAGNNTIVAGLEYHESKSSNDANGYKNKKLTTKSAYLQDTVALSDKWNFVPGVRFDHHSEYGSHWTPKAAINYLADEKTQVYASWGRVFKAPTADDLYYYADWGAWGGYYGNRNLRAERGHTESVGVNHSFNENTSASITYFHTKLTDAIAWYSADSLNYYATNVDHERKRGVELSFKQKLSQKWSYDLGYSYIDSETSAKNSNAARYLNNLSQPNGYRLGVHYKTGAWKANLLSRMGSGLNKSIYEDNRYAIFDFNLSYDVTERFTTYFKALNFTNQAWSGYAGKRYPGQGRFFQIGASYKF